jgi:hypothetical protein
MVIWAADYNLLTTTPFWISLAGTLVVVSGLTFLYHTVFTWLLPSILYCFGYNHAAESSWRIKFITKFSNTKGPAVIVLVVVIISAYSCGLFIWETTRVQKLSNAGTAKEEVQNVFRDPFVIWSEFAVSALSLLEYMFQFAVAPNKVKFTLNPIKIAQMIPVIPGILGPGMGFYYYGFQFLRFIQLYSSLTFLKKLDGSFFVGLSAELVLLVGAVMSIIFSTAGIIFILENVHFNEGGKFDNFFECIYYVVITFTTVGFGEFSPVSLLGKLFIIVGLFANFILLPTHVTAAIQRVKIWRNQRKYGGEGHVIVFSRGDFFVDFIHEFYSEALGAWRGRNMCLMTQRRVSSDDKAVLRVPSYKLRISHMSGDMINLTDTKRTRAKKADACFILLSTLAYNHDQMDSNNILRAISLKRQNPKLKVYMQLFSSQYKFMLKGVCDNVIYSRDMRASILAQNAVAPGFTTLFGNLIVSQKPAEDVASKGWLAEYKAGLHQTLHTNVDLSNFVGANFFDVLYHLFLNEGALLISVRSRVDDTHSMLDDTAIDITLSADSNSSEVELSEMGRKKQQKKKPRGCCACCASDKEKDEDEEAKYGPYRMGISGTQKIREGDQGVFIYRKKTKTLQKRINRLRINDFDSLLETSNAWQRTSVDGIAQVSKRALSLQSTRALNEILQDKFVEPPPVAPEIHADSSLLSTDENAANENVNNNNKKRKADFDPHCMLLGDRSLETLSGHVVVCVLDNYAGTHFDIPDGADTEHSPDKLQLEQSHLAPSQLHAPDLIGILKALRSRPGLRETPVIFLMLRPPSPLQLQEFEPYRGLVYFVAGSPSDAFDLQRAGATQAKAVLILATDGPNSMNGAPDEAGDTNLIAHDANSLMIYRLLEYLPTYPVIQLVFPDNCRFLNQSSKSYFFNPHYVSGHIFIRSSLHYILAQAYYKENFLQVVNKLTRANISHVKVSDLHEFPRSLATDESRKNKKKKKAVEEEIYLYKDLVKQLLARGQVPLALYRTRHDRAKKGSRNLFQGLKNLLRNGHMPTNLMDSASVNTAPDHGAASFRKRFVFTNPPPTTTLQSDDIVFVISPHS